MIAELALASDVADYVRFRAVCQPWRRCSPDPRAGGLDGRFLPRQWIMLDKSFAGPRRHRFLNVSTGECIRMDLPELAGHTLLALTPEGLLLLLHEPSLVVRLLNPLTHQLTDLPPMTALLTPEQHRSWSCGFEMGKLISVSGVGLVAEASTVAVSFFNQGFVVAKPDDVSWTVVGNGSMSSCMPFAGRFYCANYRGVMLLTTSSDQQPPRLHMVVDRSKSCDLFQMMRTHHQLVDNGGELMLVLRTPLYQYSGYERRYDVYRVDLEAGVLVPIKGFNGRAVFMGIGRAISVSAETPFSSVAADTIYLGHDCDGHIQGYNIADGSTCSLELDELVCPPSVVDCLRVCIQGVGRWLA
ncbi:hypothetical protein CFC21_030577 [Triticum aestivum]|uniref:KIB1-4 beta-propeller domain-containing protein n=3 Tax=Triticinae TaxID=1648030 RepID=A0A3B6MZ74_WHEAT|nr:hypothetical protein CFC21_030577 [Triticum aestivum]